MTRDEVREQIADILDENLILHSIIQGEPVFILKNKLPLIAAQILALKGVIVVDRDAELPNPEPSSLDPQYEGETLHYVRDVVAVGLFIKL